MADLEEIGMLTVKLVVLSYLLGHWMALLVFGNYFIGSFVICSYAIWAKLISLLRLSSPRQRKGYGKPIELFMKFCEKQVTCYHGGEVIGLDKIPKTGGAILVMYHGPYTFDLALLYIQIYFKLNRRITIIGDPILFRIPGFKTFLHTMGFIVGTVESCVEAAKRGEIIAILPGGTGEAMFSRNYELLWGKRRGFAKIAVQAQVPIIPIFTKNIGQVFGKITLFDCILKRIYYHFNFIYYPFYGWFPVKLTTYIGEPIAYDENRTVDELVALTKSSLEAMISKYQRRPGSIVHAILDRFARVDLAKDS